MFSSLFESKQQKQLRQLIQQQLQTCLSNQKRYQNSLDIIMPSIIKSNQKIIQLIVDKIKQTIKDQQILPNKKYQAILLLRDIMTSQNKMLGKYVVKKILKRLTIFAQHRKNSKDQDRGKDIFGKVKSDQQVYAAKFLNVLLSSLEQWGKTWPKAPDGPHNDFQKAYKQLIMNKIQFPKEIKKQGKSPSINPTTKMGQKQQISYNNNNQSGSSLKVTPGSASISKRQPISKEISQYFSSVVQSLNLLVQILSNWDGQQSWDILLAVKSSFKDAIRKGDQQYARLCQHPQQNKTLLTKLQTNNQFLQKFQKQTLIAKKNPQKFETYRGTYVRQSKQIIASLSFHIQKANQSNQSIPPKKQQQLPPKKIQNVKIVQPLQPKLEPMIRQTNRYDSNQNLHLKLQNLQKQKQQFNSNNTNSGRYGSIGGPTDRNKISKQINRDSQDFKKSNQLKKSNSKTISQQQNYPIKKQSKQSNSNNLQLSLPKNQSKKDSQIKIDPFQSNSKLSNQKSDDKKQQKIISKKQQNQNKKMLEHSKESNNNSNSKIYNSMSNIKNNSLEENKNKIKQNDQFNSFKFQTKKIDQQSQQDFFQKIQKNQQNKFPQINTRKQRKNQLQKHQINSNNNNNNNNLNNNNKQTNYFDIEVKKKVDSSSQHFSAFNKSVSKKNESKQQQKINKQFSAFSSLKQKQLTNKQIIISSKDISKIQKKIQSPLNNFNSQKNLFNSKQIPISFRKQKQQSIKSQDNDDPFATKKIQTSKNSFQKHFDQQFKKSLSIKSKNNDNNSIYSDPFAQKSDQDKGDPFATKNIQQNQKKKDIPKIPPLPKQSIQSNQQDINFQQMLRRSVSRHGSIHNQTKSDPFGSNSKMDQSDDNPFKQTDKNSIIEKQQKIEIKPQENVLHKSQRISQNILKDIKIQFNIQQFNDYSSSKSDQKSAKFFDQSKQHAIDNMFQSNNLQQNKELSKLKEQQKIKQQQRIRQQQKIKTQQRIIEQKRIKQQQKIKQHQRIKQQQKIKQQLKNSHNQFKKSKQSLKKSQIIIQQKKQFGFSDFDIDPSVKSKQQFGFSDFQQSILSNKPKQQLTNSQNINNQFNFSQFADKQLNKNINKSINKSINKNNQKKQQQISWQQFANFELKGQKSILSKLQDSNINIQIQQSIHQMNSKDSKKSKSSIDYNQKHVNIDNQFFQNHTQRNKRKSSQFMQNPFNIPNQKQKKIVIQQNSNIYLNKPSQFSKKAIGQVIDISQRNNSIDKSLSLQIQDFSPVGKKGISWNHKLFAPQKNQKIYNITKIDIEKKRKQLQIKKNLFENQLNSFHKLKQRLQITKNQYYKQVNKIQNIKNDKEQYQNILLKIKQNNQIKQKQIDEINLQIKKAQNIKNKILEKQKLLFEKIKVQSKKQQKQKINSRNNACKWEIFNRNMENFRNSTSFIGSNKSYIL